MNKFWKLGFILWLLGLFFLVGCSSGVKETSPDNITSSTKQAPTSTTKHTPTDLPPTEIPATEIPTKDYPPTDIPPTITEEGENVMSEMLKLSSDAFSEGERIPTQYTCDGVDDSPALSWQGVPDGTQSLALIVDDPDAPVGTWVHWVIYDIPPERQDLPESVPKDANVPGIGTQGKNDFHKIGYGGPCPPPGKPHRYFFKLYALDTKLDLASGASKKELLQAMEGHILAESQLMGIYSH